MPKRKRDNARKGILYPRKKGDPGWLDLKAIDRENRRVFLKNKKKREKGIPLQGDPKE